MVNICQSQHLFSVHIRSLTLLQSLVGPQAVQCHYSCVYVSQDSHQPPPLHHPLLVVLRIRGKFASLASPSKPGRLPEGSGGTRSHRDQRLLTVLLPPSPPPHFMHINRSLVVSTTQISSNTVYIKYNCLFFMK